MPYSREQIKARITVILKKQARLESLVINLQDDFFNEVLINYDFMIKSGRNYSQFFAKFTKDYHVPILKKLIEDLRYIIEDTSSYYLQESDLKDVEGIVKTVETSLLTDLGISQTGSILPDSYFADIVTDTSIKRTFRAGLLKFGTQRTMTNEHKAILESYIKGDTKSLGLFESFYSKEDRSGGNIFDNYQRADRLANDRFSTELGIQAWIYVGGLIDSSRPFCNERNGKIFLANEIESWRDISFQGKPKTGYEPKIDCGGYRCRHTLSGLGNSTAMRLDNTLREDKKGKLYRV
jgi:hypothetical protein